MEQSPSPDFEQWLKKMGYTGSIPKNIIYNTASEHLWAQLMKNLRPKEEVVNIRKKLIAHRIKTETDKQHGFSYSLQEVSLYNKNRKLEKRLKEIQASIEDKKCELNSLSQNTKIKSLLIQKQEDNIKEIRDKAHLLNKKQKLLEKDIEEAQQHFNSVNNFIPTVIVEVPNTQVVSETLQESADKLEKLFLPDLVKFFNSSVNLPSAPIPSLRSSMWSNLSSTIINRPRNRLFSNESTTSHDSSYQLLPDSYLDNSNLFLPSGVRELVPVCHESTPYNRSVRGRSMSVFSSMKKTTVHPNIKLLLEKFYKETSVQDNLKNLLWEHNRQVIWNVFLGLEENLCNELLKNSFKKKFPTKGMSDEDFMQLEMFHVQTELEVMKNKALTEYYNREIIKMKDKIKATLFDDEPEKIEQIMNALDLKLGTVAADVGLQVMKDSLSPKLIEANSELQLQLVIVLQNITKLEENIAKKAACISNYKEVIRGIFSSTKDIQGDAVNKLDAINLFKDKYEDSFCTRNVFSEELAVFEKFPLNYNRSCTFTNSNVYFRDIFSNTFPTDINLDRNTLHMLSEIMETPFDPAEVVLLNVLKAKKKLETLNSVETISVPQSEIYSLDDLKCRESYINFALDRLMKLTRSTSGREIAMVGDTVTKICNMQIPFKDVVASCRKVDGKEYKFYEEEFETYFRGLNEEM